MEMRNIILEKIAKIVLPGMIMAAIFLLFRGNNNPGGGFMSGLIESVGFVFYEIVYETKSVKKMLYFSSIQWMGIGLLLVLFSAIFSLFLNRELLTGIWPATKIPFFDTIIPSTPIVFDMGVFLVVTGLILTIIITIMEELKWN